MVNVFVASVDPICMRSGLFGSVRRDGAKPKANFVVITLIAGPAVETCHGAPLTSLSLDSIESAYPQVMGKTEWWETVAWATHSTSGNGARPTKAFSHVHFRGTGMGRAPIGWLAHAMSHVAVYQIRQRELSVAGLRASSLACRSHASWT